MRRSEFEIGEEKIEDVEAFLREMSFGFLGTIDEEGMPAITPLNFAYVNQAIYFHGSRVGEKMRSIREQRSVTFAVAKEFAVIPSYFSDPLLACPATSYFKSVRIDGQAVVVDDPNEKALALEGLMQKLQPEGGYKTIDANDPDYVSRLKGVAVVRIDARRTVAKFKFGQNLKDVPRQAVEEGLAQRGAQHDEETIALIRRYCPHHKE
ncbi:hypothetical protein FHS18_005770 [Paenibacillus phyllosphaerae]|uniref:Flavin-nucleotide-binding protein n=1 Tax=Paenibacillus phyllosphaerae TaxID=274593 RepID=A0A7W5B3P7_9BACL|nr:pyridoxamine 5'-phosphate oxidase family protein [Paenibacillus phyllosphaerae]MBB3113657.1 hypothetical protein [Paenibacillus phyllosphaerae]